MKNFLVLAFFALFSNLLTSSEITWQTDYQMALETARQTQKPLLLFFTGSDWCGWSMKLKKEILETPAFEEEAKDHFVFVEVDFPLYKSLSPGVLEQNSLLKEKNEVQQFPTVVLLDPKQRIISKSSYMPGGGKKYALYLQKMVRHDNELSQFMQNFDQYLTQADLLEKYYKRAIQFQRNSEAKQILEAGTKTNNNLYFLAEKYRLLVDSGKTHTEEGVELRTKLLAIDPDNQKNMQFFIALTDFQILSAKATAGLDINQVVTPLKNYLERFGGSDKENAWRLEMIMAQFYYDYDEKEKALAHAQVAYEAAPSAIKPEIQRSINYIRQNPSS